MVFCQKGRYKLKVLGLKVIRMPNEMKELFVEGAEVGREGHREEAGRKVSYAL